MRRATFSAFVIFGMLSATLSLKAADGACGHRSCTGSACGQACVPACKATWDEAKTKRPDYSMKCEYACARGRDPWHAPQPECRCRPPCGDVIVKKRLYKADGPERIERVPKYEVQMVPAQPCPCAACRGDHASDPPHLLRMLAAWLPW